MENLTAEFVRKPFTIQAVRVTAENMEKVAKWCGGEIRTREKSKTRYISVDVARPLNERQTMAYIGDHVMYAGNGYKVYNDTAFNNSFDPKKVATPIGIGNEVYKVTVDLDVINPTLELKMGDKIYQFDLMRLVEETVAA